MTLWLSGLEMAERIRARFADAVVEANEAWVTVKPEQVVEVGRFLRTDPDCAFEMATNVAGVDRLDDGYFEVVYHLQSIARNKIMTLKVQTADRESPEVPSLVSVWYGVHLQERETYDLMGIRFTGHPNLTRMFLWEGFAGWPLRKDFLQIGQGRFNPGLPHFPKEGGDRGLLSGPRWTEQERGWGPPAGPGVRPMDERRPGGHQQMNPVTPPDGGEAIGNRQ